MSDIGLHGVVGVVTGATDLEKLPEGLDGAELRADLFVSLDDAFVALERLREAVVPTLFTLRLRSIGEEPQGGEYDGDDAARVEAFTRALSSGATLVDAEFGSEAAKKLIDQDAPVLLSWHDFDGMPDEETLAKRTSEMESSGARVIKLIPTATKLRDATRMLAWVAERAAGGPERVGFAMGEKGLVSRVLSIARGAPWTYASIETSVASGQVTVTELASLYRAGTHKSTTRLFGVIGRPVSHSLSPHMHNPALAEHGVDGVYVPMLLDELAELEDCWSELGIGGLSVTIPFKEDARERADRIDDRSEACGASNTLVVRESGIDGFNTDFDGVLGPLRGRTPDLAGVAVAILGNGGAARGAVRALLEVDARPVIHFRSAERGEPVARDLGVASAHLSELRAGDYRVIINATSLGLKDGDPSPIPADSFDAETIAFDMVYDPPETRFVQDARSRGAEIILGREMLVAQGVVQFELFTGQKADPDAFERDFLAAQAARKQHR